MKSKKVTFLFLLGIGAYVISQSSYAGSASSTNYQIKFDTFAGGVGEMTSTNYKLVSVVGQSSAVGTSSSTGYQLTAGFLSVPNSDSDSYLDISDNCVLVTNENQRDTNGDGFGNICDGDLNGDGVINFADLAQMKSVFFSADPDADLNGDGVVNFADLALLKSMFFGAPGPSGLAP